MNSLSVSVARALPQESRSWDAFVEGHPEGRFCQLWGFRQVLEKACGYRCVYLNILCHGKRVGVFPAVAVRRGTGLLISQPFNEYGGPLTQGLSTDQYRQLAELLLDVAKKEDCRSVEIRGGVGCEPAIQSGWWTKHSLHSYATLALAEKEHLWRKSLASEARKAVNRARRAGLTYEFLHGPRAVEDPFYHLYLKSMKQLGVPPHPRRFLEELAVAFGNRLIVCQVKSKGDLVAALLGVTTGRRIQVYITVSDPRSWHMRPNDLAHWELISWAQAAGLLIFDFGSARYPGQIHFKRKWGVTFHEYSYYLVGSPDSQEGLKIQTVKSSRWYIEVMAKLWRWFVPTRMTAVLGPPIRRYLTK